MLCLKKQIETFKPQRIAVDSLSALVRSGTLKSFREFVVNLTAYVKARKIDLLFTNTTPTLTSGESISEDHASAVTGTIIMLRYVEPQGEIKRGIAVIKMKGAWHDKHIREFSIDNEGIHIGAAFTGVENILRGSPCTSL